MSEFAPIRVLGCMSGTSMDGVDVAVVETDGQDRVQFGPVGFRPFMVDERAVLRSALGQFAETVPRDACAVVDRAHAEMVGQCSGLDLVGFHGQTTAHDPERGRTCQIGDGARLAKASGVPVVWDFRSDDMAAGGVGAPLAPFFHHALARYLDVEAPVAFVNIGGVANVSFVDPRFATPDEPGAVLAFDCGPGNALLDDFMRGRTGNPIDEGGACAKGGIAVSDIVAKALSGPFFSQPGPKALDRGDFDAVHSQVAALDTPDGAATLVALTVSGIARAAEHMPVGPTQWFICGGGRHNEAIMDGLKTQLGDGVVSVDTVGLNGDAIEAQAFAWLAVRVLRGLATSGPSTTGAAHAVCGGRISYSV